MPNGCTREDNCKKDALLKAAKMKEKKSKGNKNDAENEYCCGPQCTDKKKDGTLLKEPIPLGCTADDNCKNKKDRKK